MENLYIFDNEIILKCLILLIIFCQCYIGHK